jgi:pentatricopeptide repeat protein
MRALTHMLRPRCTALERRRCSDRSACAHHGKWRRAMQLLDEMRAAGILPDLPCYAQALK